MKPILNANAITRALWAAPQRARTAFTSVVGAFSARGESADSKVGFGNQAARFAARTVVTVAKTTTAAGRLAILGATSRVKFGLAGQTGRESFAAGVNTLKRITSQAAPRFGVRGSTTGLVAPASNTAPVWNSAANSTFTLTRGTSLDLRGSPYFTDADGNPMTINPVSGPDLTGTGVTFNNGVFTAAANATLGTLGPFTVSADDGVADPEVTTLSVTSAAGGTNLSWTVGQAFREGDVPNGLNITTNEAESGATVLNRWPDNSVKFAVISGRGNFTANVARSISIRKTPSVPVGNDITTTDLQTAMGANTAVIGFGASTVTWSGADWLSPFRQLTAGKQMSSWHFRKAIGADTHLVAWIEVRCYKGGAVEFLPWIENGYLTVAAPDTKTGTATFTLAGLQRFSQALTLTHHTRAVLASGTTLSHWLGSDPGISYAHNATYFQQTKLVPTYRAGTPSSGKLNSIASSYTPLAQADYAPTMGDTGYDKSIGLLPEWDVLYLTSGGDIRAWRSVQVNGYCAGRYSTHYRDNTTNLTLRFSQYPSKTLATSGTGIGDTGTSADPTPTPSGGYIAFYKASHHPAMGYMAYLVTGRFYFMEEVQFVATLNYLKVGDHATLGRNFSDGLHVTGVEQTREAAWCLRTLAMAACVTPDGDTNLKAEFTNSWNANVNWYYGQYITGPWNNNLGYIRHQDDANTGDAYATNAPWQDDFFTMSVGLGKALKVTSGAATSNLDTFFAWKAKAIVGRLGGQGTDQYCYRYAARYTHPSGPTSGDTTSWFSNFGQVYSAQFGVNTCDSSTVLDVFDSGQLTTSYWGNIQPAISYAVDFSIAGALTGYNRMVNASGFTAAAASFADTPVWSVKPASV